MEEEGPDFISNLPRDVMLQIVSMIPFKEAIQTSILSSIWRRFWQPVQVNLDFCSADPICCCEVCNEKLKQFVGSILKSYDYPGKFKFCLESGDAIKKVADNNSKVKNDFLAIVARGTDKGLHFEFSEPELFASKFNLILEPGTLCCPGLGFSSLKTLRLRFVAHGTEILVKELFSSCQILENLSLENCNGLEKFDIKANHCFKNLTISDCFDIVNIKLCAPGLSTFTYRGSLPNLELTNTPHLAQVTLNLRGGLGHNFFNCEDVLSLLSSINDVEILTLSGWLLEWLCSSGIIFSRLDFKFNKLKEFWWIDSVMDNNKRDSLACFLNMTPTLEKLFVKIDSNYSTIKKRPLFHTYWHEPHLWMDYTTVKCNASILTHLKIIKMVGFTSEEDELLLMDLLLHKALNLKIMIIVSPENGTTWRVAVIPRSQVNYIVRQHQNRRLLSSPNSSSFYVLIEAKDHSDFEACNGLRQDL